MLAHIDHVRSDWELEDLEPRRFRAAQSRAKKDPSVNREPFSIIFANAIASTGTD
jgi:hypothetical protein